MRDTIGVLLFMAVVSLFYLSDKPSKEDHLYIRLIYLFERSGIRYPDIVLAQMIQETGSPKCDVSGNCEWTVSSIMRENNNWFGQKHDPTCYSKGVNRGHAYYDHPIESILAYACWQQRRMQHYEFYRKRIRSRSDYYEFLNCLCFPKRYYPNMAGTQHCYRYAEDPNYTRNVKRVYDQFVEPVLQNQTKW